MTKRVITSHKGGRTARAPSGRITPETLKRIKQTMRERKMSWSDLIEETWGAPAQRKVEQ